jgi:hypothetical protein
MAPQWPAAREVTTHIGSQDNHRSGRARPGWRGRTFRAGHRLDLLAILVRAQAAGWQGTTMRAAPPQLGRAQLPAGETSVGQHRHQPGSVGRPM